MDNAEIDPQKQVEQKLCDLSLPSNIRVETCPTCHKNINVDSLQLHQIRCGRSKLKVQNPEVSRLRLKEELSRIAAQKSKINPKPFNVPLQQLQQNQLKYQQQHRLHPKAQEKNEQDQFQTIQCPLCGAPQTLEQLDTHPNQCPSLYVTCSCCKQGYPSEFIEEHFEVCESRKKQEEQKKELIREIDAAQNEYPDFFDVKEQFQEEKLDRESRIKRSQISNKSRHSGSSQQAPGLSQSYIAIRDDRTNPPSRVRPHDLSHLVDPSHLRERQQQNVLNTSVLRSEIRRLAERSSVKKKGLSQRQLNEILVSEFMCKKQERQEKQSEEPTCPICYVPFQERDKVFWTQCMHCFHEECGKEWLKINDCCPLCKADV